MRKDTKRLFAVLYAYKTNPTAMTEHLYAGAMNLECIECCGFDDSDYFSSTKKYSGKKTRFDNLNDTFNAIE